jgi:hypothetical protein
VHVATPSLVLVGEPWMSPSSDHAAAYVRLLEPGWEHVGQEQRMARWGVDKQGKQRPWWESQGWVDGNRRRRVSG